MKLPLVCGVTLAPEGSAIAWPAENGWELMAVMASDWLTVLAASNKRSVQEIVTGVPSVNCKNAFGLATKGALATISDTVASLLVVAPSPTTYAKLSGPV